MDHADIFQNLLQTHIIRDQSHHPTYKVGATICGHDNDDMPYIVSHPNYWPPLLEQHIGRDKKLGAASTTVHAEVAAILKAPATEGADIYITELPCPNCAKMIAEARIANVYIDVTARDTALGRKLSSFFTQVSLPILHSAYISVFELDDVNQTISEITPPHNATMCPVERPVLHIPLEDAQINQEHFRAFIAEQEKMIDAPFAGCYAKSDHGQHTFLCAQSHRSTGLTRDHVDTINTVQTKYNPIIQPINRLLLTCARYGLKIDSDYFYSSQVPTSREFVNMIGAGHTSLVIGDRHKCIDEWGLKALEQLTDKIVIDRI